MIDPFSSIAAEACREHRAAYRTHPAAYDGFADVTRRTLSLREERIARGSSAA
jgi:hypothetical protein